MDGMELLAQSKTDEKQIKYYAIYEKGYRYRFWPISMCANKIKCSLRVWAKNKKQKTKKRTMTTMNKSWALCICPLCLSISPPFTIAHAHFMPHKRQEKPQRWTRAEHPKGARRKQHEHKFHWSQFNSIIQIEKWVFLLTNSYFKKLQFKRKLRVK